jgi:hypothetical protein
MKFNKWGVDMVKKGAISSVVFLLLMMLLVLPGIAYSVSALDGFNPNVNGPVYSIACKQTARFSSGAILLP